MTYASPKYLLPFSANHGQKTFPGMTVGCRIQYVYFYSAVGDFKVFKKNVCDIPNKTIQLKTMDCVSP